MQYLPEMDAATLKDVPCPASEATAYEQIARVAPAELDTAELKLLMCAWANGWQLSVHTGVPKLHVLAALSSFNGLVTPEAGLSTAIIDKCIHSTSASAPHCCLLCKCM